MEILLEFFISILLASPYLIGSLIIFGVICYGFELVRLFFKF